MEMEAVQALQEALAARDRAMEALLASERRYRTLFEHASDGMFITGPDGRLAEVNARACEMTGYTADVLCTMRPEDLFFEVGRRRPGAGWGALEPGQTLHFERELRRADGTTFLAEVNVRRIDRTTVQAIVHDVSEHRQLEEVMHRYAERLVSLHRLDQAILSAQSSRAVAEAAVTNLG